MLHRILIADDNEGARAVLADLLGEIGFAIEVASDGSDALRRLMDAEFDLTLLDVHMPNLTGLQVLSHLRLVGRAVPSILMTGHPSRALEMAALEAGAITMLRKPIPAEILRITVQQVMTRHPRPGQPGADPA